MGNLGGPRGLAKAPASSSLEADKEGDMYIPSVGERVELINDLSGRTVGFGILQSVDPDIADSRFVILKDGECRHRFYRSDQMAPCRMVAADADLAGLRSPTTRK